MCISLRQIEQPIKVPRALGTSAWEAIFKVKAKKISRLQFCPQEIWEQDVVHSNKKVVGGWLPAAQFFKPVYLNKFNYNLPSSLTLYYHDNNLVLCSSSSTALSV